MCTISQSPSLLLSRKTKSGIMAYEWPCVVILGEAGSWVLGAQGVPYHLVCFYVCLEIFLIIATLLVLGKRVDESSVGREWRNCTAGLLAMISWRTKQVIRI